VITAQSDNDSIEAGDEIYEEFEKTIIEVNKNYSAAPAEESKEMMPPT
jgi:hypothetical protein